MITNETTDFSNFDFQTGEIILIDKPAWLTSFKVVDKIRRTIKVKKVGHTGTLDPMATGLLIICTGRKTKEINNYQGLNKTYTGKITLGKVSDTMDLDSKNIEENPVPELTENELFKVRDRFLGRILQIPPMFSAIKRYGKPLYKFARKGNEIRREPREITINKFDLLKINLPDVEFEIECSKGTYLRAIANDFGKELGCGALLSSLRRIKIGEYSVEKALELDKFIDTV
jgi:tRNA pseudouridine55 synthase